MKATYRWSLCLVLALAAGIAAFSLLSRATSAEPQVSKGQAQSPLPANTSATGQKPIPAGQEALISRGQYLVDNIAMCTECHTPRDAEGNLDKRRYLQGAPIWIMPVHNMPNWAMRAPAIAGLEGFTDFQIETVLERGIGPNGIEIHPPMHIYHMNHADAQAITAYLRSLPSNYTNP